MPAGSALAVPVLVDPSIGMLTLVAQDATELNEIDGLAFDSFGNLFGALEINSAVGGVVFVDKGTGTVTKLVSGIERADQIALHTSGDFFVTSEVGGASTTNRLYRLSVTYDVNNKPTSASALSVTTNPDGIDNPEGLVVLDAAGSFGSAGDLYVAEDKSSGRIVCVTPGGATTVLVDTAAGLLRPEGMAFGDFSGATTEALFVAETSDDNILRIESNGTTSVVGNPAAVSLNNPDNVEFGPDGFLYTSEDVFNARRIIRIASDGTHSVLATGFNFPQGLAFDPFTGDLYISEQAEERIWRISFAIPEPRAMMLAVLGLLCWIAARGWRLRPTHSAHAIAGATSSPPAPSCPSAA